MMTILELSLIASAPLMVSAVGQAGADGNGTGGAQLKKHHGWKHHPNRHHHGHHASLFKAAANKWTGIFTAQCDLALGAIKVKSENEDGSGKIKMIPDLNAADETQTQIVTIPRIVRARDDDTGALLCPDDSDNDCESKNTDFNITALCAGGLLVQQWENLNEAEKKYFKDAFLAQLPQGVQDELTDENIKAAWAKGAKDAFYACDDLDESTDLAARNPVKFYVSDGQAGAIETVIGFEARKFCKGIIFAGHIWEYVKGDEDMNATSEN